MTWYEILIGVLGVFGTLGGITSLISLYHAKSQKDTIDITNLSAIIEEERKERQILREEYEEYKQHVDERIVIFKTEFAKMQKENERFREESRQRLTAIYRAYKCKYPEKVEDCPVLKSFKELKECGECGTED